MSSMPTRVWGMNIRSMNTIAVPIDDDRLDAASSRWAPLALEVVRGHLQLEAAVAGARRSRRRRGLGPDLVAGGLDGPHQLVAAGDAGVDADRRPLGGEVDGGPLHARRLLQEPLDAVDARGAGHALDGQDDLDGGGGRWGRWCSY